jgi:CheY-like chemotaxis protein
MEVLCKRILVVDDHRDVAETTAELFRMSGSYEIKQAYNGKEAVELARSFRPRVVVLDLNMPVMDGYQAARILRNAQPEQAGLLLVAMSGRNQPEDIARAAAAGFDHHFSKPLLGRELFELVASFFAESAFPEKPGP